MNSKTSVVTNCSCPKGVHTQVHDTQTRFEQFQEVPDMHTILETYNNTFASTCTCTSCPLSYTTYTNLFKDSIVISTRRVLYRRAVLGEPV